MPYLIVASCLVALMALFTSKFGVLWAWFVFLKLTGI